MPTLSVLRDHVMSSRRFALRLFVGLAASWGLGSCGAPPVGGPAVLGDPCALDTDCNHGLRCHGEVAGGLCSKPCTVDDECGDEGVCVARRCAVACAGNEECTRPGFVCSLEGGASHCRPPPPDFAQRGDLPPADFAGGLPDMAMRDMAMRDMARRDQSMTDMAMMDKAVPDLGPPDLLVPDLAQPDLAMPDLAVAPDLAMPDLAVAADLATVSDLTVAPDLTTLPDLTLVPDQTTLD